MQFLYLLPGDVRPTVTPAQLDAIGLGHLHDGRQTQCTQGVRLDDGSDAMLLAASDLLVPEDAAADLRYVPAEQTWRDGPKVDGRPAFRVGYWTARRPGESTLRRAKMLGGTEVPLRDGSSWRVPVAVARFGNSTLPYVLDLDDAGEWSGRTAPEYEAFSALARTGYDWLMGMYTGRPPALKYKQAGELVTAALSLTYRVGKYELAMLALLDDPTMWRVIEAVCDWGTLLAQNDAEKKTPATSA